MSFVLILFFHYYCVISPTNSSHFSGTQKIPSSLTIKFLEISHSLTWHSEDFYPISHWCLLFGSYFLILQVFIGAVKDNHSLTILCVITSHYWFIEFLMGRIGREWITLTKGQDITSLCQICIRKNFSKKKNIYIYIKEILYHLINFYWIHILIILSLDYILYVLHIHVKFQAN